MKFAGCEAKGCNEPVESIAYTRLGQWQGYCRPHRPKANTVEDGPYDLDMREATPTKVWILTEEHNTGDSEHDTTVVSVHGSQKAANDAKTEAILEKIENGHSVYAYQLVDGEGGDDVLQEFDDDGSDWDYSFEVEAHEVQP